MSSHCHVHFRRKYAQGGCSPHNLHHLWLDALPAPLFFEDGQPLQLKLDYNGPYKKPLCNIASEHGWLLRPGCWCKNANTWNHQYETIKVEVTSSEPQSILINACP
eukprot:5583733-Amphidinium_carterae.1